MYSKLYKAACSNRLLRQTYLVERYYSNEKSSHEIKKLRNLGILAHIDAGKTTTTERMLFYSGLIKQMGEVHHGNTVTDYMSQERERGITIKSAAVTFNWKNHQFNLIDTPGHIDFTMEVEQTLNVLDGAVVVLDGCAGVEAQTLTVWRQADRYKVPRIVYVNKMDRPSANLKMSCESIEKKLNMPTICLQMPIIVESKLIGLIDLLTLEKLIWDKSNFKKEALTEKTDMKLWEQAQESRNCLIDKLSEYDDDLANTVISSGCLDNIGTPDVTAALRKATIEQKVIPVLCGSSYKNVGVQPLMDSIILYLPSPNETKKDYSCFEENLCARAFKVVHDKQRGALVFFRIYSGAFSKSQRIHNMQKEISEQAGKLFVAYADEFKEVETLGNGNIAVATGLKHTMTGDLVTNNSTAAQKAKKKMLKEKNVNDENLENVFGISAKVPEPVFFCSIEPPSLAYQSALEQALDELEREDPSLRVTNDSETGQTVLAGMGELHLEVIKDRILKEYKIEAELGPLQIAYRECPINKIKTTHIVETKIGNSKQSVSITFSIIPATDVDDGRGYFRLDRTSEAASDLASIYPKHLIAVRQGVEVALSHGPKLGSPVINSQVMLHHLEVGRGTSETIIAAAATQCVQKLLVEAETHILEPIMYLEVFTPEEHLSSILADISRRRALIQNVTIQRNIKIVIAETPLAELLGYSTTLRSISSGTATFSMQFTEYKKMAASDEQKVIESVRGF